MLTKLIVRNFKRFGRVEIELGSPVVFICPSINLMWAADR